MSESILAILRHEHHLVKEWVEKIEGTENFAKKLHYFEELKAVLVPHMKAEEETIYQSLRRVEKDRAASDIADELDLEHHDLKEYLQRLTLMEPDSPGWTREFKSFREHIYQHIEEEESELFEEAKEDFSRLELERLSREFEAAKNQYLQS